MRDFFQGWRRKAGCIALLIALLIMAWWARSYVVRDTITTPRLLGQTHMLTSSIGVLECVSWTTNSSHPLFYAGWRTQRLSYTILGIPPLYRRVKFQLVTTSLAGANAQGFAIPHWLLAIPPTLLSAYLLLRKPQKQTSPSRQ